MAWEDVYQSEYLEIYHERDKRRFVMNWFSSPANHGELRAEFLMYVEKVRRFKPKQLLWIQTNLSTPVTQVLKDWIDVNVTTPTIEYGGQQLAFVVSLDPQTTAGIAEGGLHNESDLVTTEYFSDEIEAMKWLDSHLSIVIPKRIEKVKA